MNKWDEEAFREVNDLDAARLALRGALATIRDLQDLSSRLKSENQDEAAKLKHADARVAELAAQIENWRGEAELWERERRERADEEGRFL